MNIHKDQILKRMNSVSDEFQLLLWTVRLDDHLTDNAEQIVYSEQKDHAGIVETLGRKGLVPLLYQKIKMLDQHCIDPALLKTLQTCYMENVARNMRMVNDLERICKELEQQGVSYIAYKGPVAGKLAYNDTALRQFCDLDLMVRHQEFEEILQSFKGMGFRLSLDAPKKVIDYVRKAWRDIGMTKGHLHVDIHQQIAKGPSFFRPFDETWETCVTVQLDRASVNTFSPEDALVAHSINNAKDGFSSLKQFRDIAGLIHNHPDLDWNRVLSNAKKRRCLTILLISVKLAYLFCGVELPGRVSALTDRPAIEKKVRFYVDRLFATDFNVDILSWYLTVPACLDTVLSKFHFYVWFASKPAPRVHPEMFRLPGFLFFLFPVLHPFTLLYRYGAPIFIKSKR